jgi:hypothetical protein
VETHVKIVPDQLPNATGKLVANEEEVAIVLLGAVSEMSWF